MLLNVHKNTIVLSIFLITLFIISSAHVFAGSSDDEDNNYKGKRANPRPEQGQDLANVTKKHKSLEEEDDPTDEDELSQSIESDDEEYLEEVSQELVRINIQSPEVERFYLCLPHICKQLEVTDMLRLGSVSWGCQEALFHQVPSPWKNHPIFLRATHLDTPTTVKMFESEYPLKVIVNVPTYRIGGQSNPERYETSDLSVFQRLVEKAISKGQKVTQIIAEVNCYKYSIDFGHQATLQELEPNFTTLVSWMRGLNLSNVSFNFTIPLCSNSMLVDFVNQTQGIKINKLNVRSSQVTLKPLVHVADLLNKRLSLINELHYGSDYVFWYGIGNREDYFDGNAPQLSEFLFARCGQKGIFKQFYN